MYWLLEQEIASLTIGGKKILLSPSRMIKGEKGLYRCREGDWKSVWTIRSQKKGPLLGDYG